MREILGDFWKIVESNHPDAIVCTTNGVVKTNGELVMGAGIAKQFRDRYPGLALHWGSRVHDINRGNKQIPIIGCLVTQGQHGPNNTDVSIVYFQTKLDYRDYSIYSLVEKSAIELSMLATKLDWKQVIMTRPGCGNGGLKWSSVKPRLDLILDDRFIIVDKDALL